MAEATADRRRAGGWADAVVGVAAGILLVQVVVDGAARAVAISAQPARLAVDLGVASAVLLAMALLLAQVARPAAFDRRFAALAAAMALTGTGLALRARYGLLAPVGRWTAPIEGLALVAGLVALRSSMPAAPRSAWVVRALRTLTAAALVALPVRLAVEGPDLPDDVRSWELGLLAAVAGVAATGSAFATWRAADRRRAIGAAAGAAIVVAASGASRGIGLGPAGWIVVGAGWLLALLAPWVGWGALGGELAGRTRPPRRAVARLLRHVGMALVPVQPPADETDEVAPRRLDPADRRWYAAMAVVAVGTIVADLAWAYRVGAQPIGHGATVAARSWDVGTRNTPLVGMPTSFADHGRNLETYHPGPLLFALLAPFVRLLGIRDGAFVGSAAISLVPWLLGTWAAFRAGGRRAAVGAWVAGAVVVNFILRDAVFEVANTFPVFVAILATPLLCWAAATGTRRAFPLAVVVATLTTQAYLAHTLVVAVPVAWAALVLWCEARGGPRPQEARRWLRIGLLVALLCWTPPLIDVVVNGGGNVRSLYYGLTSGSASVGPSGLWRAVAWTLQVPLTWNRLHRDFAPDWRFYLTGLTPVGPVLLAVFLVICVRTRAQVSTALRRLWVLAALVLAASGVSLMRVPDTLTAFYQLTWLAVVATFLWFVGAQTVGTLLEAATRGGRCLPSPALGRVGFGIATVILLAWAIRTPASLESLKGSYAKIDAAVPQLVDAASDASSERREVLILGMDGSIQQTAADVLSAHLIAEGRAVRVEPYIGTYYGHHRVAGVGWTGTAFLVTDGAAPRQPDGERIARVVPEGWTAERSAKVAEQIKAWATAHGPVRLGAGLVPRLQAYVQSWMPSATCKDFRDLDRGTTSLADLPAGALAQLYVDELVTSPQLPKDLRSAMQGVLVTPPIELWRVEVPRLGSQIESNRLRNDLTLCP